MVFPSGLYSGEMNRRDDGSGIREAEGRRPGLIPAVGNAHGQDSKKFLRAVGPASFRDARRAPTRSRTTYSGFWPAVRPGDTHSLAPRHWLKSHRPYLVAAIDDTESPPWADSTPPQIRPLCSLCLCCLSQSPFAAARHLRNGESHETLDPARKTLYSAGSVSNHSGSPPPIPFLPPRDDHPTRPEIYRPSY